MKKLTEIFYDYFYEKVDIIDYDNALSALQQVIDPSVHEIKKYHTDTDNKYLKCFIKEFYKMKENVEARYISIRDYSNSLEGQARPIRRKLISKNAMRELEKLYPKFDKFAECVNNRLKISLASIYCQIQEEEEVIKRASK